MIQEFINTLNLPYKPYPDQVQAVEFLTPRQRAVLADEVGVGKTYAVILSYLFLSRFFDKPCVLRVLTTKTGMKTWHDELSQMGINYTSLVDVPRSERLYAYNTATITVQTFRAFSNDVYDMKFDPNKYYVMIVDEIHNYKNHRSAAYKALQFAQMRFVYVWGLTATAYDNSPAEFLGILTGIHPSVGDYMALLKYFFFYTMNRGRIKVKYSKKAHEYVDFISQFLLRRKTDRLPDIVNEFVDIPVTEEQKEAYKMIFNGQLKTDLYDKHLVGDTHLIYAQFVADAPEILGFKFHSPKELVLLESINSILEQDPSAKIIIYSYFKMVIDYLVNNYQILNPLFITGDVVKQEQRAAIQDKFMNDPDSHILFINNAASAAINLPKSRYMIQYSQSWSPIDWTQAVGRMRRSTSPFKEVLVLTLLNGRIDYIKKGVLNGKNYSKEQIDKEVISG